MALSDTFAKIMAIRNRESFSPTPASPTAGNGNPAPQMQQQSFGRSNLGQIFRTIYALYPGVGNRRQADPQQQLMRPNLSRTFERVRELGASSKLGNAEAGDTILGG